ncbi:hypothetical protein [Leifsonia poae]|uniref:hypothetical protein n=1 Tax=Leifsonia poae TaxID=110933 RepID=UPI003D673294
MPASAVIMPHVKVELYRAFNYGDSYGQVRHYNKVNGKAIYAPWVGKNNWSTQNSCAVGAKDPYYGFKS